jgi:hypothetical protein
MDVTQLLNDAQERGLSSADAVVIVGRAIEIGAKAAEFRRNQTVGHIVAQAAAENQPISITEAGKRAAEIEVVGEEAYDLAYDYAERRAKLMAALNGSRHQGEDANDTGC